MVNTWKLRYGGEVMDEGNRKHVRRNTINHFVHHRAQTTVYLPAQRAIKRKDDADASAAVDSQTDSVGAIAGRLHATCRRFVNLRCQFDNPSQRRLTAWAAQMLAVSEFDLSTKTELFAWGGEVASNVALRTWSAILQSRVSY